MNREEAVKAIKKCLPLGACDCRDCWDRVFDAIGFDQMQDYLDRIDYIILDDTAPFPVCNEDYPSGMDRADALGETLAWYRTTVRQMQERIEELEDTLTAERDEAFADGVRDMFEKIEAERDDARALAEDKQTAFNMMMDTRVEVSTGEAAVMRGERDAARALADQLAQSLRESTEYEEHDERQNQATLVMEKTCPDCSVCRADTALAAYEARDWK